MPRWTSRKIASPRKHRSKTISLDETSTQGIDPLVESQIVAAIEKLYGQNKMSRYDVFDGKDRGFWMLPDGTLVSIGSSDLNRGTGFAQETGNDFIHHGTSARDITSLVSNFKELAEADEDDQLTNILECSRVIRVWINDCGHLSTQSDYLTEPQIAKLWSFAKIANGMSFDIGGEFADEWKDFIKLARENKAIVNAEGKPV